MRLSLDPDHDKKKKQQWYQKNKKRILAHYQGKRTERVARSLAWSKAHPDAIKQARKRFMKTPQGRDKAAHDSLIRRFREHDLTLDQYHAKLESQDFSCAICSEVPVGPWEGSHDGFHIDHNHVSNRVRGLLCGTCNPGIGMFKDSPEVCTAAAEYLLRHSAR